MKFKLSNEKIIILFSVILLLGCKSTTGPKVDPLEIVLEAVHVSLHGLTDGSIDLTVTGGVEPYTYSWSNGETTEDINNLAPGTYTVEVTDSKGSSITDTAKVKDSIHGKVTDYDGNVYNTVKIGEQWWMAENLKVTHDPNGNPIQSYVYEDDENNEDIYGRLYTWDIAMNTANSGTAQGIAPDGWHIPSTQEWKQLIDFLGGAEVAGGKMKEQGTEHWGGENVGATNSSGFSARAGGELEGEKYQFMDGIAIFWSANPFGPDNAYYYYLSYDNTEITSNIWHRDLAYSIRCVQDTVSP